MTRTAFSALLSHWVRHPLQLFALIAGISLATALWSGVQAINAEARASYDAAAATLAEGQFDQLVPRVGETFDQKVYVSLRRAGWLVSPVLEGTIQKGDREVRVLGVDFLTTPRGLGPSRANGDLDLAKLLGGEIVFANRDIDGLDDGEIQIDANIAPNTVLTDIGRAQTMLGLPGQVSRLIIASDQPLGQIELSQVAPELLRKIAGETSDIGRLTDSFHLNLTAFGLLSFAVGIFIVHGTISLAFEQRRPLIRTLRALGVPMRRLIWLLVAELLAFALIAGLIGVVLGYFIAAALLPDVAATIRSLYGAQVDGSLQLRPIWWATGLGVAVIGTGLASGAAIWKIAQLPLLSATKARAWMVASGQGARRMAWTAVGLLAVSLGIGLCGSSLVMGFALLACLLIGVALLVPFALSMAITFAQGKAKSPISTWFFADTRAQVPGLSLALMALLLATAANVGVSTMVSSFRLTFTGFLDQRLAPELFIAVDDKEKSASIAAFLMSRSLEILPLLRMKTQVSGQPAELYGVRVGKTYREDWKFLDGTPDAWDRIQTGQAAVINEQLARRSNLWVGADLEFGPGLSLPVAGVVADYGNPIGQVVIGETLFRNLHADVYPNRFGVRTDDVAKLRDALKGLGLRDDQLIDQTQIKAVALQVFERTFKVTGALNILTLGVAAFAILMSMLTLADLRLPQLAPVWALGLTRRKLASLEMMRAIVLAALTTLMALPLGLLMAWVLLSYVNVVAFGWKLPMFVFPGQYLILALFAVLAAAIAALWPAISLARKPPSSLLRVFANDH